jgi:hypothetical protein
MNFHLTGGKMGVSVVSDIVKADGMTSGSYSENVREILNRIQNQFVRAVKDVNVIVLKEGEYSISFSVHQPHHDKGRIKPGTEFDELTSYGVKISKGPEMNYDTVFHSWDRNQEEMLFLEKIILFSGRREELKRMAETGNISTFEEVYTYWVDELKKEITFFRENQVSILTTKDKINQQFIRAVKEIKKYNLENNYKPISINPANFPSCDEKSIEEHKFEPLQRYSCWEVSDNKRMFHFIGSVKIIGTREQFKKIVCNGNLEDFQEVFRRCSHELKIIVDLANAPLSGLCTLI